MLLKSQLVLFWTAIVLSLGQVSCAPDKAPQAGEFRMPAPTIASANSEIISWSRIDRGIETAIDTSSHIVFADQPISGVQLKSKSICKSVAGTFELTRTFHQPGRVPLLALVPVEVSHQFDKSEFQCRFSFLATAQNSSRHSFEIRDLKIASHPSGSNWPLKIDGAFQSRERISSHVFKPPEFARVAIVAPQDLSQLALQCRFHRIEIKTSPGQLVELSNLDYRLAFSEDATPLEMMPRQNCRFEALTRSGSLVQSDLFRVEFPAQEPLIESIPYIYRGHQEQRKFAIRKVTNTFKQPIWLNLPPAASQTSTFLLTVSDQRGIARSVSGSTLMNLGVQFSVHGIEGQGKAEGLGTTTRVRLEPGASVLVGIHLTHQPLCQYKNPNIQGGGSLRIMALPEDGIWIDWWMTKDGTSTQESYALKIIAPGEKVAFDGTPTPKTFDLPANLDGLSCSLR